MSQLSDVVLRSDETEGTTHKIGSWHKRIGDPVRKDEPLVEVVTDKVSVEIAAPADGVLTEILKPDGEDFSPGEVLGRIGPAGGGSGGGPRTTEVAPAPRARAEGPAPESPDASGELSAAVRRLLEQHGLAASAVRGTGRGGRISVQDVEAHLAQAAPAARAGNGRMVPHTPQRKSIAQHMVRSMATAPHVTAVFEADLSAVLRHRDAAGRAAGATLTTYFVRAAVTALQAVPEANARWHEQALELFSDCNVGVAVALPGGGLIVPVVQGAQDLDLAATAARVNDLTARARAGKLEPRDVQSGTFTISNHGVSGSLVAAPIVINQPQTAILGVGKLEQRARVVEGRIEARPMAYVTLTIDHRALDGFQANAFLSKWVEVIEAWS